MSRRPRFPYHDVPGRAVFQLIPYQEDPSRPNGVDLGSDPTLRELRQLIGGDEGQILDPLKGEYHQISLAPYSSEDSDRLRLAITWRFKADKRLSEEDVRQRLAPYRVDPKSKL